MMFGKTSGTVAITSLTLADQDRLEALCQECRDFFELVQGQFAHAETAEEILGPLPPTMHECCSKSVLGLECAGELVGVVELMEGYPKPYEWYVGLLLLKPKLRREGTGTAIWRQLRAMMEDRKARVVRLVVEKQNEPARLFWEQQGFSLEEAETADCPPTQVWRLHLPL